MPIGDPKMIREPLGDTFTAPADAESVTIPEADFGDMVRQFVAVRYWLTEIQRHATKHSIDPLCNTWAQGKFKLLANFAEHGLRNHDLIDAALLRKALGGN